MLLGLCIFKAFVFVFCELRFIAGFRTRALSWTDPAFWGLGLGHYDLRFKAWASALQSTEP